MNITVSHWEQNTLSHFLFYSLLCADRIFNIVQDNKGSTVRSHIHMRAHIPLSQFTWWVICHSASVQILHGEKINKKLVMHTLTFLFPVSLAERASCGSWLHNHTNTTHLEPNKVRCFHKKLTLLIHVPCILPRRRIQMLSQDNNNSLKPSSHDMRCGLATSTTFLSHSMTQS